MFKVNSKYSRTKSMTFYGVFIVNSEHILHLSLANFEQGNVCWEATVFENNALLKVQRCI